MWNVREPFGFCWYCCSISELFRGPGFPVESSRFKKQLPLLPCKKYIDLNVSFSKRDCSGTTSGNKLTEVACQKYQNINNFRCFLISYLLSVCLLQAVHLRLCATCVVYLPVIGDPATATAAVEPDPGRLPSVQTPHSDVLLKHPHPLEVDVHPPETRRRGGGRKRETQSETERGEEGRREEEGDGSSGISPPEPGADTEVQTQRDIKN